MQCLYRPLCHYRKNVCNSANFIMITDPPNEICDSRFFFQLTDQPKYFDGRIADKMLFMQLYLDLQVWLHGGKHTVTCDCDKHNFQCKWGSFPYEFYTDAVSPPRLAVIDTQLCNNQPPKIGATYSCNSFSLQQVRPLITTSLINYRYILQVQRNYIVSGKINLDANCRWQTT